MRVWGRLLLLSSMLVLLLAAAVALDARRALRMPLQPPQPTDTLTVPRGSSWQGIVRQLATDGWLQRPRHRLYLRVLGRVDPRSQDIRAGEYALPDAGAVSPLELLTLLHAGETIQHPLRIIEGRTLREALAAIRADDRIRHTLPDDDEAAFAVLRQRWGIEAEHPEGWILPETWFYERDESDVAILDRAHRALREALEQAWAQRREKHPVTRPADLLTLASIVEKETGLPEERGRVAGVFVRRLEKGMRLQTDPTVIYGQGPDFQGRLRSRHLRADTPYNTYTRAGLPPTPICLPGRASLMAAAQPAPGTALYFVSRNDGSHKFSDTLQEHNRAVQKYQRGGG